MPRVQVTNKLHVHVQRATARRAALQRASAHSCLPHNALHSPSHICMVKVEGNLLLWHLSLKSKLIFIFLSLDLHLAFRKENVRILITIVMLIFH